MTLDREDLSIDAERRKESAMFARKSPEDRLAALPLEIDRADSELRTLEEKWKPPYSHAQPIEDKLDITRSDDPLPRIGALAILQKIAAARERVHALRAEQARMELEEFPEQRLAELDLEATETYEAQQAAHAEYKRLRTHHFHLQAEASALRERHARLQYAVNDQERYAHAAGEEAAKHQAGILALQGYARALVQSGKAAFVRGLLSYVADLDTAESNQRNAA